MIGNIAARKAVRNSLFTCGRSLISYHSRGVSYQAGDVVGGFKVQRVMEVPSVSLQAIELVHEATKARHVHLAKDDINSVFSIGFKTNPPDLSGLPHILEHTTLCGSKKYPVRDPFFKMLTRSLANFMNAMTGSDYTFYPFATTNKVDFKNLQNVYLDAVYNPLLRPSDFRQEGWRIENEITEDQSSPLVFKGVVYNEMKGQISNPSYLFYSKYLQSIYPSLNSSGGDPAYITNLAYQDLKDFHDSRYHPSNSFTLSYGMIELPEILKPIDTVLEPFSKNAGSSSPADKSIKMPLDFKENVEVVTDGPVDPLFDADKQYKVSLSWVLDDSNDVDSTYLWKVLSLLLMDGHSSPLHQALIDTHIGTDYSANSGLDTAPGKNIFTIGLEGLEEAKVPLFKQAVFKVFEDIVANGIPASRIEAIVNQAELADREIEANYGMGVVYKLFPRVFNATDPFELLDNEKLLANFKQTLSDPTKIQTVVMNRLLNSPYFQFTMKPSSDFEAKLQQEEDSRLQSVVSKLSETDKQDIHKQGIDLLKSQQDPEDISSLPTLVTGDIDPLVKKISVDKIELNTNLSTLPLYIRNTDTGGLSYIRLLKDISHISSDLIPFLPLYTDALLNVGTSEMNMDQLESHIKLNTGGVGASLLVNTSPLDHFQSKLKLHLNGCSLDSKTNYIYNVINQVLTKSQFGNLEKLKPLIQGSVANSLGSLSESGHSYAVTHAASSISPSRRLSEKISGIEQILHMKRISKLDDSQLISEVVPLLEKITKSISTVEGFEAGITTKLRQGDNGAINQANEFFSELPKDLSDQSSSSSSSFSSLNPVQNTFFKLPFQVSYVGVALPGVGYTHPDGATLQILANLLTHKYLHKEIREKGGAYGGGASYSALDGIFSFYSYRDPDPINSIKTITKTSEFVSSYDWTDRHLHEAKLSIFQNIDAPISPRSEISGQFLSKISDDLRQQRRSQLLDVGINDIKQAAEKYLAPRLDDYKGASITVLGPQEPTISLSRQWKSVDIEQEA